MGTIPPINTQTGFFQFDVPRNKEELSAFLDELVRYTNTALETPISVPHTLVVTDHLIIQNYCNHAASSGRRELLPIVFHPAFKHLDSLRLVLTSPLQVGQGTWSQVWKATISSTDLPSMAPGPVVIKIYQQSLFKVYPTACNLWDDPENTDWYPGAHLAAREAWAYERIEDIQGDILWY